MKDDPNYSWNYWYNAFVDIRWSLTQRLWDDLSRPLYGKLDDSLSDYLLDNLEFDAVEDALDAIGDEAWQV